MKNYFKAYATFTRTERMGIVALLVLMVILVVVRFTMHLWVQPKPIELSHVQLPVKVEMKLPPPKANIITIVPPIKLNLNTIDSITLVSMPGIGKGLSHRILERRRQLGRF